ncbi:uncharacterized protein LOC130788326 isoform X2 [Actinidia eriantha]|uniref:uncharacterized protein LOC130788326 isoform X2 n=1 Tax=Actinidia eriantha TaxID=165200 RepID=UPI002582F697|nr:uncharacterized protein LOC130788326 isoform X2 [Actinidia eriantha]
MRMLLLMNGATSTLCEYGYGCSRQQQKQVVVNCSQRNDHRDRSRIGFIATAAAAITLSAAANAFIEVPSQMQPETLLDIPQMLSGEGECSSSSSSDCKKAARRIQRPKSRKAESCTIKCVTTCIRGGDGEGPFNVRSLVECSDICNLIGDGDDGP